jgi:hypothetical protein
MEQYTPDIPIPHLSRSIPRQQPSQHPEWFRHALSNQHTTRLHSRNIHRRFPVLLRPITELARHPHHCALVVSHPRASTLARAHLDCHSGPNAWLAVVQPVPGGNLPNEHHIELKLTFKDGGAPEFHSSFERIKERLQQAVSAARESNLRAGGLGGVNLDAVHLDQLPSYESSGQDRIASSAQNLLQLRHPVSASEANATTTTSTAAPAPPEAPPGYEETQQRSVQEELERRLGGSS